MLIHQETLTRTVRLPLFLLISICLVDWAGTAIQAEDLSSIRKRQVKIKKVVQQNLPAVVAVTDGIGYGSGVIVSKDGLVLTAGHVMANAGNNYKVILPSGRELKAVPLGKNLNLDAGMVKIVEEGNWPFVELGEKKKIELGDWAICLGHPGGFEIGRQPPVRAGKILEINKHDVVTDCALIGGDSGGPLFDLDGKLIGIHSSIGNHIAINRHVSINAFRSSWDKMKSGTRWGSLPDLASRNKRDDKPDQKKSSRAGLGVTIESSESKAMIIRIRANSPAQRVGMKVGDIITVFEGQKITSSSQLIELIKRKQRGDSVSLTIVRNTSTLNYQVILSDLIAH